MMARFPAPMSGWSAIVPTVVDTIVTALAEAMPDRVPAGHHGLLGGAVVFFGVHPEDQAPVRRAEHRGRRLGRPAVRGRRVGDGLGLPGRRAQRLDRGHRARNARWWSKAARCGRFVRRGQVSRRARHRHAGAQPGRGPMEFRAYRGAASARPGACGAASRASPAAICCGCRARRDFKDDARRAHSGAGQAPRRSCAPAAAAAGAIRWSAIPRWSREDVAEGLISAAAARRLYGVVLTRQHVARRKRDTGATAQDAA